MWVQADTKLELIWLNKDIHVLVVSQKNGLWAVYLTLGEWADIQDIDIVYYKVH